MPPVSIVARWPVFLAATSSTRSAALTSLGLIGGAGGTGGMGGGGGGLGGDIILGCSLIFKGVVVVYRYRLRRFVVFTLFAQANGEIPEGICRM